MAGGERRATLRCPVWDTDIGRGVAPGEIGTIWRGDGGKGVLWL